jgi:hypothetical protein
MLGKLLHLPRLMAKVLKTPRNFLFRNRKYNLVFQITYKKIYLVGFLVCLKCGFAFWYEEYKAFRKNITKLKIIINKTNCQCFKQHLSCIFIAEQSICFIIYRSSLLLSFATIHLCGEVLLFFHA